jgi:hypothetical protein
MSLILEANAKSHLDEWDIPTRNKPFARSTRSERRYTCGLQLAAARNCDAKCMGDSPATLPRSARLTRAAKLESVFSNTRFNRNLGKEVSILLWPRCHCQSGIAKCSAEMIMSA